MRCNHTLCYWSMHGLFFFSVFSERSLGCLLFFGNFPVSTIFKEPVASYSAFDITEGDLFFGQGGDQLNAGTSTVKP